MSQVERGVFIKKYKFGKLNRKFWITLMSLFFLFGLLFIKQITGFVVAGNAGTAFSGFIFALFLGFMVFVYRRNFGGLEVDLADVASIETAKGSVYTYLPNGKTQRYKKVTGETSNPQDVLIFIPNYEWIMKNIPSESRNRDLFGQDEEDYIDTLLMYLHGTKRSVIVTDSQGRELKTNEEVDMAGNPYCAFSTNGKVDFYLPATGKPRCGFFAFDLGKYKVGNKDVKLRHLGNKVVKINFKDGRIIS